MPHAGLSASRGQARRSEGTEEPQDPNRPAGRNAVPAGPPDASGAGVPGRRTVMIQGRGAERYTPNPERRRPPRRPHERAGFKPDRIAMWAVLLGVVLILVAATSSHAAVLSHAASTRGALMYLINAR